MRSFARQQIISDRYTHAISIAHEKQVDYWGESTSILLVHTFNLLHDWLMKFSRLDALRLKINWIIFVYFSDFMQRGASLTSSQLIKLITRGKTSRLSAEPLLEFFRPLVRSFCNQGDDTPNIYFKMFFANYVSLTGSLAWNTKQRWDGKLRQTRNFLIS